MSEYKVDKGVDQKIVKFPGAKNVYLHFSWIYYGIQIYDGKGKLIKKPSSVNSLENGGIIVPGDTARILVPSLAGSFTIDDIMPMYDDNFEVIEPTCTTGGYHRYTYCGKSTNLYIVPALGHCYDRELKCIRPGCGKVIPSDFGRVGGDYRENFTFQDAKSVEVYFSDISTYDYVRIYDGKGTEVGKANLYWSNLDNNSVTVKGNTVTIVHDGIYDAGSFKIAGFVPNYSDSAVSGLKRQLQDINKRPEEYTHEHMMSMLDAYEMVAQNKEYREQMQADPEFMQLIENLASKVKAQNHRIDHDNYSVMLFGAGSNGTKTPDWRYILSSKNISVPDEIKAKLGAKWKILASEDITVSCYGDGAIEGKFTIGFSGNEIERYKNATVVVYHLLADGTVEELKATWNEEQKCFTVVTDSFSPFVLAVKADSGVSTGDDSNIFLYGFAAILALLGAGYVYRLRRKEEK